MKTLLTFVFQSNVNRCIYLCIWKKFLDLLSSAYQTTSTCPSFLLMVLKRVRDHESLWLKWIDLTALLKNWKRGLLRAYKDPQQRTSTEYDLEENSTGKIPAFSRLCLFCLYNCWLLFWLLLPKINTGRNLSDEIHFGFRGFSGIQAFLESRIQLRFKKKTEWTICWGWEKVVRDRKSVV